VRQAIDALSYSPNRVAQSLSLQRTKTLGVVVESMNTGRFTTNPFCIAVLDGFLEYSSEADYQVKIVLRPLHFGIGMRRGEIDKLQWLNTFVYTIKNNGELEAISRKWRGLPLENLPVF